MIITRTPLRISFFGGGTDYPVWYRQYGGAVLATTIDKCCYITTRWLPPFFEYHSRILYSRSENVDANSSIQHPSVRACLQHLGIEEGVEIHHIADLPARTGLGTSSAFTVGLLLGLYALKNQMRDKRALAADAIHVEQELLQEAVGAQDQVSAAYGGLNRINFNTDDSIDVKRVLIPANRLAGFPPESRLEFNHPWPPVIVKTNYQAPFFLANSLHFLDSPGEWFEDLAGGKVYYWPRTGEDIQQANVIIPRLENIMKVEGAPDSTDANICFKGIIFAHTTWMRSAHQGHVPLQAGMFMLDARRLSPKGTPYHPKLDNVAWIGRPPAAVSVKDADQVVFEDCTFTHLASAGLDLESGAHNDSVIGCVFRDIGGNGIQLGIYSDTNVETHLPYLPSNENDLCTNDTLANNLITDCGNEDWGCVGMCIGYARGIRIEHNEVFNLPYTGISVGWGWTKMTNALGDNYIHANHVHDVAKRLGDTAGIYTLSAQPGTVISENSIHDIHPNQYVPDPDHWFYIYLDEGSSFITVQDNWCPGEKFLKNANGPGNVWKNNGPWVSKKIQDAAGLEPQYRHLLSDQLAN